MEVLMKKVGIIGGTGPESTIDYYRYLVARYRECVRDGSYPCIIINSVDLKRLVDGLQRAGVPSGGGAEKAPVIDLATHAASRRRVAPRPRR